MKRKAAALCIGLVFVAVCVGHAGGRGGGGRLSSEMASNAPPPNDNCSGALSIPVGDSAFGNNSTAGPDETPTCFDVPTPGHGLWYSVTGTGNTMTVSTCSDYTSFDTVIQVFCDCESLECVAANDDDYSCPC